MRTLTINLQQTPGSEIDTESVTVEVRFFDVLDRTAENSSIIPSRMLVSKNPMKVSGAWRPNQPKIATASYTVPTSSGPAGLRREQFYGFTVRVFHAGILQDQTFRPAKLKDYLPK